jgi:hypothetical protein
MPKGKFTIHTGNMIFTDEPQILGITVISILMPAMAEELWIILKNRKIQQHESNCTRVNLANFMDIIMVTRVYSAIAFQSD